LRSLRAAGIDGSVLVVVSVVEVPYVVDEPVLPEGVEVLGVVVVVLVDVSGGMVLLGVVVVVVLCEVLEDVSVLGVVVVLGIVELGVVVVVVVVELVSGPVDPSFPAGAPVSVLCATATPATTTRQAAAALVKRVTRVFIPMTP